jgi:hypothetical protein
MAGMGIVGQPRKAHLMLRLLSSQSEASGDSVQGVTPSAILAIALAARVSRDHDKAIHLKPITLGAFIVFLVLAYATYFSTLGGFVRIEINCTNVWLQYAGPFSRRLLLPRDTIEMVLFGIPERSN